MSKRSRAQNKKRQKTEGRERHKQRQEQRKLKAKTVRHTQQLECLSLDILNR